MSTINQSDAKAGPAPPRRGKAQDLLKGLKTSIEKKPTLLQQASSDWDRKKKEENIEEELKQATKSKTGYLDKVGFLERSDLKQFEKEREIRDRLRARQTKSSNPN